MRDVPVPGDRVGGGVAVENNSAFYGDFQDTPGQARGEVRPVVE